MHKKLSQWATENPTEQRRELYNLLCNEVWLRVAHHSVNANQGRETPGIDGKMMSNFNGDVEGNLERLRESLKAKHFEPMPVRRVYIPKANGKKRPLDIPTIDDRIVQEALRMILEPIWEADLSNRSYGFRPNRSTYDAIAYLSNHLVGPGWVYQWVIEGDITSYFDTIPHRRLIKAVKKRVADRDISDLLWKFLRAGVMEQGNTKETLSGTPQGGIVSPLLANIYLHELDKYMESTYLSLTGHAREWRRHKGKANFLYVRYADDFVVLCNRTKAQALKMKEELKGVLETLGLKLSEEKTKVTHITEGFTFLGYQIIKAIGTRGEMVLKVLIPEEAIKRYRYKVREITAPRTTGESTRAKIMALNQLTRGWCRHYRITSSPSQVFNRLNHELFWETAHWLGKKYKTSIPKAIQRFRNGNTLGTKSIKLVMPQDHKTRRRVVKAWHNPYTEKEKVKREKDRITRESLFSYDQILTGDHDRPGGMDRRKEVLLRDGPICAKCGEIVHPSELQMDHIRSRARFKDPTEADSMDNLQLLCTPCHRAKTETDLKVLSRMR